MIPAMPFPLEDAVKAPLRSPPVMRLRRLARRSTSRWRALPTFLIIGAQRAGTTTLFTHLRYHPQVVRPRSADGAIAWPKELHFFDENYWRGVDWYRAFFPLEARMRASRRLSGRELVTGESTPYYLFHPAVPERVAKTLPDVRLIALLRNPVDRAYSHHQLMVRTGREDHPFAEAIEAEPRRLAEVKQQLLDERPSQNENNFRLHHHHRHRAYLGRGLYAEQLERWLQHFPREQLLVIRSEDLFARPQETFDEVFAFLGIEPRALTGFAPRNTGSYSPIDAELRTRLEAYFEEPNARLARLLGRDFGWGPARTDAVEARRSA
jgi:hypothetical protein